MEMPPRRGFIPFAEQDYGALLSEDGKELYYIGIIDILTFYNTKKRVEHCVKSIIYGDDISCVPPRKYAQRFARYMEKSIE